MCFLIFIMLYYLDKYTACQKERHRNLPWPGRFAPECDSNGNYKKQQCHLSNSRSCWCVDKNGNEITGTRVQVGSANCQNIPCKYILSVHFSSWFGVFFFFAVLIFAVKSVSLQRVLFAQ